MTDTGSRSVRPPAEVQLAAPRPRETSVDELFGTMAAGSGSGSGSGARRAGSGAAAAAAAVRRPPVTGETPILTAEAPILIVDDQIAVDVGEADTDLLIEEGRDLGLTRSPAEVAIEDIRRRERLRVVADTGRSKAPLGLAWCAAGTVALLLGPWVAALLFAPVAFAGAVQTAAALRRDGHRTRPLLAGACALAAVLAAVAPSSRTVGAAVLVGVAVTVIGALHLGGCDLDEAGDTIRAWLPAALAAAAPVALTRAEPSLAVLLFLLVCAYDVLDHLVGSAAASWFEGPVSGAVAVVVVGFVAAVAQPGTLDRYALWPAVVVAAVCCPLGQLAASLALPRAGAFAPALRRVDTLVVAGPLWILLFS